MSFKCESCKAYTQERPIVVVTAVKIHSSNYTISKEVKACASCAVRLTGIDLNLLKDRPSTQSMTVRELLRARGLRADSVAPAKLAALQWPRQSETNDVASAETAGEANVEDEPAIVRTSGVCGGSAHVAGTRIPVWMLHALWCTGASDDHILAAHPTLSLKQLLAARDYVERHRDEIARDQREQDAESAHLDPVAYRTCELRSGKGCV